MQENELDGSGISPGSWDGAAIWKIYRAGGAGLVGKLCTLFLDDAGGRIAELRGSSLHSEVIRVAHGFKTNCRMLGAMRMADLCHGLVERAEAASQSTGPRMAAEESEFISHVVELEAAYGDVRARIEQIRDAALRGESPPELARS